MAEEMEDLVLEHLRHIRGAVDRLGERLEMLTQRVGRLVTEVAGLHAEAFPQAVQPDPFLPLEAQLAAAVPAASAAGRLAQARSLLNSWCAGTGELVLSAPVHAQDLAGDGELADERLARLDNLISCHLKR